ncbi:MFS transporter [Puniceicoccaceae bacterium K14]|nr:MFS transporter [Puniceicoccaceae bacterium K14]
MATTNAFKPFSVANIRLFVAFRIFFNARYYYPIFTVLFLDFGLSIADFAILNAVWAATIVLLEVPSGALADTIGRKNLVLASAIIMVIEVGILCLAPIGNKEVVFYLFLLNRILSGTAEAAASGADEALAYDSLKEIGQEESWGSVLESQMKLQSIAFVIAMSLGAFLYDASSLNTFLNFIGISWEVPSETALKLPLFLTLAHSFVALGTAWAMKDPKLTNTELETEIETTQTLGFAFKKTISAGKWILKTPAALTIILAGMLIDHVGRMVVTLNSQYFREIQLPEASFGLIGSGLSLMGIIIPTIAKKLTVKFSQLFNFILVASLAFTAFSLMTLFIPFWGALPIALLYICFFLTGFFVSHYLNKVTSSEMRATVLSFRGLSYNLAYGTIGVLYARLIGVLRANAPESIALEVAKESYLFREATNWFPGYFVILFSATLGIAIWLNRKRSTSL